MVGTNAGIYTRISADDGRALGVARQEKDCRKLAAELGAEVVAVFCDNDLSASDPKVAYTRPGYLALLDAVRRGDVDLILAAESSRLTRIPAQTEDLITVCAVAGATVDLVKGAPLDPGDNTSTLIGRIMGAVSAHESAQIRARVLRKHLELAERGMPAGGGSRPFGYNSTKRSEIIEPEAEIIRKAAQKLVTGSSLAEVTRYLNSVSTGTTGKPWRLHTVRSMLNSASIAGLREHHVRDVSRRYVAGPAVWSAIIDQATHDRIRAILEAPRKRRPAQAYLLTGGLAECGLCGSPLGAQPRGADRSYRCLHNPEAGQLGCGKIRIRAAWLEDWTTQVVLQHLANPAVVAAYRQRTADGGAAEAQARATLAAIATRRARLTTLMVDGVVEDADGRAEMARLTAEREAAERELEAATSGDALASITDDNPIRERWEELDLGQRRSVIRAACSGPIVVKPGLQGRNRADFSRIHIPLRQV
jgi:site-specific DNA recombinase